MNKKSVDKVLIENDVQIEQLVIKPQEYQLSVAGVKGLKVRCRPNGTKDFLLYYQKEGKFRKLGLGTTNKISLPFAKAEAHAFQEALLKGLDAVELRRQGRLAIDPTPFLYNKKQMYSDEGVTVEQAITDWLAWKFNGDRIFSKSTMYRWKATVEPILKAFGDYPLARLQSAELMTFFSRMCKNSPAKAFAGVDYLQSIYKYAKVRGLVHGDNPCDNIKGFLMRKRKKHVPAITDVTEFKGLMKDIQNFKSPHETTVLALRLLPLVFTRIGDFCTMAWDEVDLDKKQWEFVPQKQPQFKSENPESFIVPLSRPAVEILSELKQINPNGRFVFSSIYDVDNPCIDESTLCKALWRMGYKDRHCPHGFRASARSILREVRGWDNELTELQLGHTPARSHNGAYDRTLFLEQRHNMMADWADFCEDIG